MKQAHVLNIYTRLLFI